MDAKDPHHAGARASGDADRPLANTYWVETGRLLAGEYPGAGRSRDAEVRLQKLLNAGIDYFIDLTEADELPEYESLLAVLGPGASYRRFAIEDHGLPEDAAVVAAALDCVDEALAAGHKVYLHCRAGVGRTGTVLGCYLVRHGAQNEEALDRLAELWQQSERSNRIPQIPETEAQATYVRYWHEPEVAAPAHVRGKQSERVRGALLGLALGEAVAAGQGASLGPHTAMTLLLAESLVMRTGNDPDDQMRRYQLWRKEGRIPGATVAVEVPPPVSRAVATWQWSRKSFAGPHDPANLDPHTLARTTAVALYLRDRPEHALEIATEASRTTQQAPVVLDCCRYFAALMLEAVAGATKPEILALSSVGALLQGRALKPEVDLLRKTSWQSASQPATARTATAVLSAALAAFAQSRDFDAGLDLALRTTGDRASVAAIYGALAGAHYGFRGREADAGGRLVDAALIESAVRILTTPQGSA
ncbi:MAG: ADP-ribosylglycohydrolase family protein [Steroidobacteraceae bacterium]